MMAENGAVASREAESFLTSHLNKTLRIHTTDTRMFVGQMKCTDKEQNIILSVAHEYRQPSPVVVQAAALRASKVDEHAGTVKVDMLKRFVGLVVVPGQYITKIEVEE